MARQCILRPATRPRTAVTMIRVLADHGEAPVGSELPKLAELCLRMLVNGADPAIQRG